MRLMRSDVQSFMRLVPTPVSAGYVGTANVYIQDGYVEGHLSPATDNLSVELFGNKSASMYTLITAADAQIAKGDRVILHDGSQYNVISVMPYTTHKTATLSREEAG